MKKNHFISGEWNLTCDVCSLALGNLEDNIGYLQNAISYLGRHNEKELF